MRVNKKVRISISALACLAHLLAGAYSYAQDAPSGGWVTPESRRITGFDFTGYTERKDIIFTFRGESFTVDKPSLVKGPDVWVPVEPVLRNIEVAFLNTGEQSFGVIRPDGVPLELKIGETSATLNKQPHISLEYPPAVYDGTFMIYLKSLSRLLDMPCDYNESANTVTMAGPAISGEEGELETFTVPRPKEPEKKKSLKALQPPVPKPMDIRDEPLPVKYRKDLDAHLGFAMSYLGDEASHDRTRQAEWTLSGRALDYDIDGNFRMKDFNTSDKDRFKQDGERLLIAGKDVSFRFFDNYMTIPTLRSQSQSYFGTEITHRYSPFATTFFWGRTDNTVAGPAAVGSVRYYGNLIALRSGYGTITSPFRTNETLIIWENDAANGGQAGTTIYPRRNLAFITENTYTPYKGLELGYSLGISNYQPDNKVNASFLDTDWKVRASFIQPRYSFSAAYERVGDQFVSIGMPETYQDYEGSDFSMGFQFTKNWRANVGAQLYKNNVERNPRIPTSHNRNLYTSTSLDLPWQQTVSVGYTINESSSRGGDADESGSRYKDFRVDYTKGWGNMSAQLSLDHYDLEQFKAGIGGSTTDQASISLFNSYPEFNNSYIRFYQSYRKVKTIANASYTTEFGDTAVTGRLNITKYLSAYADWRVSYTVREAFTDTALMTFIVGGEFSSSPVTTWNFDFTLNNYDLYDRSTWVPKSYTVLFKGRHTFDIYSPDKWGKVAFLVYKDVNGNSRFDAGDEYIKDARVYISGGREARTNSQGRAVVDKVVPGSRIAKIDLSTIPLDFVVRGPSSVPVTVKQQVSANIEFPIVRSGNIRGRVYIDNNKNGLYDAGADDGLPNARVYLTPGGNETLTLSDGSYYFDFVYPGAYEVTLDLETTPTGVKPATPEKVSVQLKEGETLRNTDFVLAPRPVDIQYVSGE